MSAAPAKMRLYLASIRGKIALACLGVSLIVGAIGIFGVTSMTRAGALVVETYDKPLMAISFARAIHADFADMQAVAARRQIADGTEAEQALTERLDELAGILTDDLSVISKRATSDRVRDSVDAVARAVATWQQAERAMRDGSATRNDWDVLDAASATVREEIDLLVNYAAGDGFLQRKQTLAAIDVNRDVQIGGIALAALLTALVMFNLSRRIIRPVAAASTTAHRIAGGDLDAPIIVTGRDELAALAQSMTVMRDNIRAMMEREIAQRRSAQMRLVDAIESSTQGVLLVDPDRRVLLSNREIEDFCGGSTHAPRPGDTLDEAVRRIVTGGVFALRTEQQRAEMLIQLRMMDAMDVEAPLADGRWVRLSRSATTDGGAIFIVSDITLVKERESMLRDTAERAEAANRAKSEFLATMSHELRTPLNAVIGFSEIIAGEALGPVGEPQYKEFAGEIVTNGRGLLKIINDILMLVKSESGELIIEADEIDLGELVDECADSMRLAFDKAGVALEIGPSIGRCVALGDRTRLRQAVLNLMSNAAKFTPEGGATRLVAFCAADNQVGLSVSDTGIGMREEDVPVALAAFGQVDSGRARQYEGTGLGLTLAKAIVELHCGELRIDTAPGRGTTVAVFLPAAASTSSEPMQLAS